MRTLAAASLEYTPIIISYFVVAQKYLNSGSMMMRGGIVCHISMVISITVKEIQIKTGLCRLVQRDMQPCNYSDVLVYITSVH